MIATEANKADITEAKELIKEKGTPDFNITSPSIKYGETVTSTTSIISWGSTDLWVGDGYTFDPISGVYTITNGKQTAPTTLDFSNGQTYYTNLNNWYVNSPIDIYKITGVSVSKNETTGATTYNMPAYTYSKTLLSYDTAGVGMYASADDQGDTYYYRGSVSVNYVKMAGKYWRIIRVNGDNTLRVIYDGTVSHENGDKSYDRQVGTSSFNSVNQDNTYAGYMYADPSNFVMTDSENGTFAYTGLSSTALYYFSDSYTFDKSTRKFKLSGNIMRGTIGEDKVGYYTLFSTNKDATNGDIHYTTKYNSSSAMTVKVYSYGTSSKEEAQSNIIDSNMKQYLDNWYTNNLTNYDNIISKDSIFCNNREVYSKSSGNYTNEGYGLHMTIYKEYQKFNDWVDKKTGPDLSCPVNDSFSVTTTNGNGKLTKSIGLITADEVNMAGGLIGSGNSLYYLYTGSAYWTMSPNIFCFWFFMQGLIVGSEGTFGGANNSINYYGVRPVINIDTSKITFTGVGTKENPYNIEIK